VPVAAQTDLVNEPVVKGGIPTRNEVSTPQQPREPCYARFINATSQSTL